MSRVARSKWIEAVVSGYGPAEERDRHLCHVLAHCMRGDGSEGCYPGQRYLATMISSTHRTVARSLARLRGSGWLTTVERRRQFGKIGAIYFPAIPDELLLFIGERASPIVATNGESKALQSGVHGNGILGNGECAPGIGESAPGIGETGVPRNLTETKLKRGSAAPRPAVAGAAAPHSADWAPLLERASKAHYPMPRPGEQPEAYERNLAAHERTRPLGTGSGPESKSKEVAA